MKIHPRDDLPADWCVKEANGTEAKASYDAFASYYDDFNYHYQYERWTGRLLAKAEEAGFQDRRLLDVACGTGFSFLPMLDRGFSVTACDISEGMLAIARTKAQRRARLTVADMRALPEFGEFDLVWSLNDSLNYLLSAKELEETLEGFKRNLSPDGIALFDLNTPVTYRGLFSDEVVVERAGRRLVWQGRSESEEIRPGSFHEAEFRVDGEPASRHVHRQRYFAQGEVLAAIEAAGMNSISVLGDLDGTLFTNLDEDVHSKAVYLCRVGEGVG